MGAHPWTQQNISTGVKYFAGLGPQSLLFWFCFLAFFLFNIAASLSTSKCRTWTVRLSYPFEKPDRTPGSSAVSQTEMCTVRKWAFIWAPAQPRPRQRAEQSAPAEGLCCAVPCRGQSLVPRPRHRRSSGARPSLPTARGAASRSVSCGAAPGVGAKIRSRWSRRACFPHRLPRGRLSSPRV